MIRKLILAGIALTTVAISSCDEDTNLVGNTLTSSVDQFTIVTDTFNITTRSVLADSVLSRGTYTYLGKVKDPETGSYITCDYMTQFTLLEKESTKLFPERELMLNLDDGGMPQADSCVIRVMVDKFQGDSLAAMKMTVYELKQAITEKRTYYSNFDPEEKGMLRTNDGGVEKSLVYTLSDLTKSDSLRAVLSQNGYYRYIDVLLDNVYTDNNGKHYNNYGTYIMQKYYNSPELFRNANTFIRNVCPGFYVKSSDGHGCLMQVGYTQLIVHFKYKKDDKTYKTFREFNSSEEVLRTSHIMNDKENIQKLVNVDTCTYLKTPAGIYTEVTLPVEEIKMRKDANGQTHENDTITSAKVVFSRMRDRSELSETLLEQPTNLLLVERDSLYTFFENNQLPDNVKSFLATYSSSQNTYSFNNIASLINRMWKRRNSGNENWNKAILIPVQVTTTAATSTSTSSTSNVSNDMNVTSTRLVGGDNNRHAPIRMSVIYNKSR